MEAASAFLELLKNTTDASGEPSFDARLVSGVEVKHVEPGKIVCTIRVPSSLTNGYGTLHGGATASLVDAISTCAILTMGASNNTGFSTNLSITYTSAAKLNEELEVESKVLKMGKNIVMLSAELRKADGGEIVATAHHTKYFSRSSQFVSKL